MAILASVAFGLSPVSAEAKASRQLRAKAVLASQMCAGLKGVRYFEAANVLCVEGKIDIEGKLTSSVEATNPKRGV